MAKKWPDILNNIVMIARRSHRHLSVESKSRLLSVTEHHLTMEMYRLGGECGYEDLIRATHFHKSTISRGVAGLEKKDYVKSYSDPDDIYRKRACLQENGIEYAKVISGKAAAGEDFLLSLFSETEKKKLLQYLARFYQNMRIGEAEDTFPEGPWPFMVHYCLNTVRYLEETSAVFQNDGREANQKHMLLYMLKMGGSCSYKEMEYTLSVAQTVIVRQMVKLEEKGLAFSKTSENDRRVKLACLTDKGVEEAKQVLEVFQKAEKLGCKGFTGREKKQFAQLTCRILER